MTINVPSFAAGAWVAPDSGARPIACAITGDMLAQSGNANLDVGAMHAYAREVGGPN